MPLPKLLIPLVMVLLELGLLFSKVISVVLPGLSPMSPVDSKVIAALNDLHPPADGPTPALPPDAPTIQQVIWLLFLN
jgi:hypothetical protein